MGVKRLLHWQPAAGEHLSQQTYDDVAKALENLPSSRRSRWNVSCALLRPQLRETPNPSVFAVDPGPPPARELFSVSLPSDLPGRQFLVLRHEHLVLEAGASLQAILDKLQLYRHRVSMHFEGFEYAMGEVRLRAGRATSSVNEVLRGLVLEVELAATESMEASRSVVQEFISLWDHTVSLTGLSSTGSFVHLDPDYASHGLSTLYFTPQHTALLYALASAHFMAARA